MWFPGLPELISLILFAAIFVVGGRILGGRLLATHVLQELVVDPAAAREGGTAVFMRGRPRGLIGFIQTMLGVEPSTRITITALSVQCDRKRISGTDRIVIPMQHVNEVYAGFRRPIAHLAAAIFVGLASLIGWLLQGAIVAGLAACVIFVTAGIVYYALNKKLYLIVGGGGSCKIGMFVAPNYLEGQSLDLVQAMHISSLIRALACRSVSGETITIPDIPIDFTTVDQAFGEGFSAADEETSDDAYPSEGPLDFPIADESPSDFSFQPPPETSHPPETAYSSETADTFVTPDSETLEAEDAASRELDAAKQFAKAGEKQRAIQILQALVKNYPKSMAATKARSTLKKRGITPDA